MPLRAEQIAEAAQAQELAARDDSSYVRVVAGPGTGKSATIEQRVQWLLEQGIEASSIAAISFTRLAAKDLGERIVAACEAHGIADSNAVSVSTLHSLALRVLRSAGALGAYLVDPVVLGAWELRNVFEAEFGEAYGVNAISRREVIRRDYEAFLETGEYDPDNLIPPNPPISTDERDRFKAFHSHETQLYSCVLPGEVVAKCVSMMDAGTLDPVELLGVSELIVDEFQDLNPMDLRFVNGLADRGVRVFAAGDDDQSLYAFRFATPEGIEQFPSQHEGVGDHTLTHCFRCTPSVLDAAQSLIRAFPAPGRIPKDSQSLWAGSDPPVQGELRACVFQSGTAEAQAIATSCANLIAAGMEPRSIMILVASTRSQASSIHEALTGAAVPFAPVKETSLIDTEAGRAGYALLSIVEDPQNYVAHRTLLGIRRGVGISACAEIANAVVSKNRNFRELFYGEVDHDFVSGRALSAIQATAEICATLSDWTKDEPFGPRLDEFCAMIDGLREPDASNALRELLGDLPAEMSVEEVHAFLSSDRDEDRVRVLTAVAERLELGEIQNELVPDRVQVLTMHGAKGLSAKAAFIPGLEDSILPGDKRRPYPGLVLEAARMFYVSITRARYMCIVSYAQSRVVFGSYTTSTVSRFAGELGATFVQCDGGLTAEDAQRAVAEIQLME